MQVLMPAVGVLGPLGMTSTMRTDTSAVIIAENQLDDLDAVRWLQSRVSDPGLDYVVLPHDCHLTHAWPHGSSSTRPAKAPPPAERFR